MIKVNLKQEWRFIIIETHREKIKEVGSLKRELLFTLQILLSRISGSILKEQKRFMTSIYLKSKEHYLSLVFSVL